MAVILSGKWLGPTCRYKLLLYFTKWINNTAEISCQANSGGTTYTSEIDPWHNYVMKRIVPLYYSGQAEFSEIDKNS